jgi:capsular exopolysaccharide synthesis family protein
MTGSQEALHFLDYWRVIRARKEVVIAMFLLVVTTGVIFTMMMPKSYEAICIIQVKDEAPDLSIFPTDRLQYDPLFLRTQFKIIQSEPIIREVVKRQRLDKKLADVYGLGHLKEEQVLRKIVKLVHRDLRVQHHRDTNLIEIRLIYSEPEGSANEEVAKTANWIAEVYREFNMNRKQHVMTEALAALKDSVDEQEARVKAADAAVEEIREKYKITTISRGAGSEQSLERAALYRLMDNKVRLRMEYVDAKADYEKMNSLPTNELVNAAHVVIKDPSLDSLVMAERDAEIQLSQLIEGGFGKNHPTVVSARTTVSEISSKISEALDGLKQGLLHEVQTAQKRYIELERMFAEMEISEILQEADGYQKFDKAIEKLEHARDIRDALEFRYIQEKIQQAIPSTTVEVIEKAMIPEPDDYISPKIALNIILSIILGLCSGVGLAYFVEYVDTSVKTIDDVETFMEQPVVGVIPQKVDAFTDPRAYRDYAEAYRMLRTNVRLAEKHSDDKAFCITSGSMAEGKSLTVFNLAYVCAQHGDRVLIVDSDLHRPRQHKMLDVSNDMGLANVLRDGATLDEAILHTEIDNLHLMTSGDTTKNIHGLFDSGKMRELVRELKSLYDFVLFDAPPIIGVSDASLLVRQMDGVLLVIQHRKYPRSVSMRAKAMVENAGGKLAGVVLNRINVTRDYSYYYHYSSYYYQRRGAEDTKG